MTIRIQISVDAGQLPDRVVRVTPMSANKMEGAMTHIRVGETKEFYVWAGQHLMVEEVNVERETVD